MRISFILLASAGLVLLVVTGAVGTTVLGEQGFYRHFLLGILTGFYLSFVHVVAFMYFVVQGKIAEQAVISCGADPRCVAAATSMKARALTLSVTGIASVLLVIGMGAAIDIYVSPGHHRIAAVAALAANAVVFVRQYRLIRRCGGVLRRALEGD